MAITGVHLLVHTPEADATRHALRDIFDWPSVDIGGGWLIFRTPPAEIGVHPGGDTHHEISLTCDDLDATLAELSGKGVTVRGEPQERRFGRAVEIELPGGVVFLLYQPSHPSP